MNYSSVMTYAFEQRPCVPLGETATFNSPLFMRGNGVVLSEGQTNTNYIAAGIAEKNIDDPLL